MKIDSPGQKPSLRGKTEPLLNFLWSPLTGLKSSKVKGRKGEWFFIAEYRRVLSLCRRTIPNQEWRNYFQVLLSPVTLWWLLCEKQMPLRCGSEFGHPTHQIKET